MIDEGGLKMQLADGEVLPVPPQRVNRYAALQGPDDDARASGLSI